MRIGLFSSEYNPESGGAYTFVNDVLEAFFTVAGESRHEFILFCPPDVAAQLQKRALPSNVRPVSLAPRNIAGHAIAALKHLSPIFSVLWRHSGALERAAKREGIQLMWFIGGFFDTLDIPYIANVWDIQHLTHPWFPEVSSRGRWDYKQAFMTRHLERAARIITGTQAGKEELKLFYRLQDHRIHILPHPTPSFTLHAPVIDAAQLRKKFNLPEKFLLYPAQFWPHKNHINLLLALDVLRKRRAEMPHLALAGSDKGNKEYILQTAAQLGLAEYIHVLGFVSIEELTGLYQAAEALVYASFSGPENLPPLEAFALRCPVVVSDYPGSAEQLGDAALYFDPHDPGAIADAITKVLKGSAEKTQRIEKGLIRARQWTGQHYVRKVIGIADEFEKERRCWP